MSLPIDPDAWEDARKLGDPAVVPSIGLPLPDPGQPAKRLQSRVVDLIKAEKIDWFWPGWVPLGMITILDGIGGIGKSTICDDIVARYTAGFSMPDEQPGLRAPGNAIIWSPEDPSAQVVRPRLDAHGADLKRVRLIESPLSLPADVPELQAMVIADKAGLVVISPLMEALSGQVDSHRAHDVRHALAPLREMAVSCRCAVLIISHWKKGAGSATDRGIGSSAIGAVARSMISAGKDPEDENKNILAPAKRNIGAPPSSLAYRIVSKEMEKSGSIGVVQWLGASTVSADDLAAGPQQSERKEDDSKLAMACSFLQGKLKNGPLAAAEVEASAKDKNISEATLRRACKALNIQKARRGFGPGGHVDWSLAAGGAPNE